MMSQRPSDLADIVVSQITRTEDSIAGILRLFANIELSNDFLNRKAGNVNDGLGGHLNTDNLVGIVHAHYLAIDTTGEHDALADGQGGVDITDFLTALAHIHSGNDG